MSASVSSKLVFTILVTLGCHDKMILIEWLQHLFRSLLEPGKSKLRCQGRVLFLACPSVLTWQHDREDAGVSASSYKDIKPIVSFTM